MATNDQNNAETLENLSGSIGAVALGQIATEGRRLKVLAMDGILPTAGHPEDPGKENSASHQRSLAFAKSLYLVRIAGISPLAQEFAEFVFSPDGQDILGQYDHTAPR
ncbi:MAG: hypothetical protein HKN27_08900 [Silicimonas sp.]|nr:hypothetical protein [Silicimonas sp.]